MKLVKDQRIRKKITFLLVVTSFTVLFIATAGFAISDWITSQNEAETQLISQAALIGNNSSAALVFRDQNSAMDTLNSLRGEENIQGAYLYDAEKKPFASFQRGGNQPLPDWPSSDLGYVDQLLFVQHKIKWDGETIGYIVLQSHLDKWKKQQVERLQIVLLLFLFSMIVAVLIANFAQKIITNPILKLADTVRNIARTRDYQLRTDLDSGDEIGELAHDFNDMLNEIQIRDSELQAAREQLEEKVKERTSELLELAKELEHLAYHDSLTGLANRAELDERLQGAISLALREKQHLAVLFMDLDRFKGINDSLGHHVGDKLLVEVGKRLQASLRGSDVLARLGGDEFAVLLHHTTPEQAAEVADKLIEAINTPFDVEQYNLQVTTSIGISLFPEDGDSASAILKSADTAMYNSKESGRNQFSFYAKEMNERAERRLFLERNLRKAVRDKAFEVVYQPKWNIQADTIVGLEALVRWNLDGHGYISPADFIPIAEDCGLISEIDSWVMQTACREVLGCYGEKKPEVRLSVNFSPVHFMRFDVSERVKNLVQKTGFPSDLLELEITETVIASEMDEVYEQLSIIREMGIEISIDDFGIAYSSLSRLKQLPLNTLKIDRSFIQDIGKDADDEVIVRTIIDMAHNLNLKVVAEGVETEEQYHFVRKYHCDAVQGFLFSRPMSIENLRALLSRQ